MDEIVVVVESDKLSQEIRSPFAGVISKTLVDEGADIPVGDPLFVIDTDAKAPEGGAKPAAKPQAESTQRKAEAPKAEASKSEDRKAEAPKAEAPKAAPRQDTPKATPAPAEVKSSVKTAGTRTERRVRAT